MMATMVARDDIRRFSDFIRARWGISVPKDKGYLLEAKLRKALDSTGFDSLEELLETSDEKQLQKIAQAITTNHTFFFREADHFDILVQDARKKKSRRLLIWSAAASSGEECYSLAIRLLEEGWDDFRILASDIDHGMLQILNQGVYPESRLENVQPHLLRRYFDPAGHHQGRNYYQVRRELRDRVIIKSLNLLEEHRFPESFDYLLCRNVLIYFDHPTQGQVIDSLSPHLKTDGLLFLGHSESLTAIPHSHRFLQVAPSVYRQIASAEGGSRGDF